MLATTLRPITALLLIILLAGCQSGSGSFDDVLATPVQTEVNPSGRVPLSALLQFTTREDCSVKITVPGESPLVREFPAARMHEIPVLGLYPGTDNKVSVELTTTNGESYQQDIILITEPLPENLPDIEITQLNRDRMEPGFHLFDFLMANNGKFLPYTVMFDDQGVIRWFMDMREQEQISYTTYRLKNGNWLYLNWIKLLEVDDLGRTVREEQMWNNAGNHEVIELPNGQLLMGGSKKDSYVVRDGQQFGTRYDHVVLWDRENNRTTQDWDMRAVFPVSRAIFPPDYGMDPATDWFHVNSIAADLEGDALLVSGRNQGVVKIGLDNKPKWFIGPHVGWTRSGYDGQGFETSDYLLTAVDAGGNPYPKEVQEGRVSAPDFDWPMGQHSLNLLPNGNVLLFDNGLRRYYNPNPTYSRAVEYAIDEENMTIRQVWQYGKERGLDFWSPITSDVDALPETGNRLITSGNVRATDDPPHATLVEVTYPDNEVVFEAHILFKDKMGSGEKSWGQFDLVFRGERYPLLPD